VPGQRAKTRVNAQEQIALVVFDLETLHDLDAFRREDPAPLPVEAKAEFIGLEHHGLAVQAGGPQRSGKPPFVQAS